MFSSRHFSNFPSDPIGKQSAMSKRGEETTSSRSPWSARENPQQDLEYSVNPVNDDEGQGDHTSTRRLVRTTQNPVVERSQVRRQENAQSSDSWKRV